jgi:cell division protein FtsW
MIAGFFGVLILSVIPGSRFQTWKARIENFGGSTNKDATYQADQAKIAIATGGIVGKGPGRNPNKYFLPHSYSDFIYAIIIGEYGLLGGMIVLSLYLILFIRSLIIARQSEFAFATFLVVGLSVSIFMQAAINMAVSVGVFPVTGQPLPMISMGGTSTLFTCITIGMILSVSRSLQNKTDESGNKAR